MRADEEGADRCDDVHMAFSELSLPWRARGHSNPRGGLLLCHGFTGSPQSMRPWAEDHAARGWAVELPLLPGHGTTEDDLAGTTWQDWYECVREAALDLSEDHGPIAVGGLSMGGALTLALAADSDLQGRIAAVVAVNPGMTLPAAAGVAGLIAPVVRTLPGIGSDIALPGAAEEAYGRMPVRAVAQLHRLFRRTRRELGAVQVPLLLATSSVDHTVPPSDSDIVAAGVRGSVERLAMPHSYHLAPLDHDAQLLFDSSARFLARHVPSPGGR
ncbi:alpha/beta fold hydrolase [Brachybacterium sp. Z12]|uniref:alpha/beta hydrolase n=1 Tax=Brachybacterium sp. Z12 TaxID=2759167 RepID=UPI00292A5344|nr:alpha/beta fold hydrolase [Brachybacterium sp. Z12]